jgi:peptidoglycan/xylan/chitin deacetylase (PgdA/CDA1 family)
MYHEVLPDRVDIPSWLIARESVFVEQIKWLREQFDVVDLDTALSHLSPDSRSPRSTMPMAVITFDDGYAGNFEIVYPIMRSLSLPFTVYVASAPLHSGERFWHDDLSCALLSRGWRPLTIATSRGPMHYRPRLGSASRRWSAVDLFLRSVKALPLAERCDIARNLNGRSLAPELRMLRPAELAAMSRDPLVTVGNHTHRHDLLDQLPIDEASRTIGEAQTALANVTGSTPRHFCYPNGNTSPATIELVRSSGFATAVTTTHGCWMDPGARFEIPRLSVGRFDSIGRFRQRAMDLVRVVAA